VKSWDTIIAGAGIIGVSLALELQTREAQILVLESGEPGHEASSAAAGMLAPSDPETPPALRPLAAESARMFPEYVRKLEAASQMQVDFRRLGTIAFLKVASAPQDYKNLSIDDLQHLEPLLQNPGHSSFFVQEDSVDPHLLMQAALAAACKAGIDIRSHHKVTSMRPCASGVEVVTEKGSFITRAAVDCRGAWSGTPVKPRKGQMLYVQPKTSILRHVLRAPEVYVVPRSTGKILVGATVEDVGYDKSVNPSAIQTLLNAAAGYLPELASAPITQSWAGLRPGTPDDLPIIGPTETPGLFVASGHFRNGILLAPVTAQIMADLLQDRPAPLDISAFSPARFSRQPASNRH
jgi:glycine oxidase